MSWVEKLPLKKTPPLKSGLSDYSLETKLSQDPNSGKNNHHCRYHLRRQRKTKPAQGQILSVNEIFEKRPNFVKTYGIVLRYQSRTSIHNMYKEFRDVSLNGAISQLHQEMAGNHRANKDTISIIRTSVLHRKDEVRRPKSNLYRDSKLRFPILRSVPRASHKRYRTVFKANRPNTFKQWLLWAI